MVKKHNIFKKIGLLLILLLISIMGVNAVEYLNSCGKNTGWTNGETYYLNFTEIPLAYANGYCLELPTSINTANITINGLYDINILKNNINFIHFYRSQHLNFTLNNISIYSSTNQNLTSFLYLESGGNIEAHFKNSTINNINLDMRTVYPIYTNTAIGTQLRKSIFNYNTINNFNVLNGQYFLHLISGNYGSYGYAEVIGNKFNNGIITVDTNFFIITYPSNPYTITNNNFTNYVINTPLGFDYGRDNVANTYNNYFINSMFKGEIRVDSNDDGISEYADTWNIYPKIYIDLNILNNNYRFLQDFNEAEPFFNVGGKDALIPINNGDLGSPLTITLQSPLESSLIYTNFTQASGLIVVDEKIDCSLFDSEKCKIINRNDLTTTSSNKFFNYINTQSNTNFNNINFTMTNNGVGYHKTSVIGNYLDVTYNNITIKNNYFEFDSFMGDLPDSRQLIKLKGNNIEIKDNVFTTNTSFLLNLFDNGEDLIYVEGTNYKSNKIHNNQFLVKSNLIVAYDIFGEKADAIFYNNYLNNNTVLANVNSTLNINVTPLVSYLHNDGNLYYYYVGNYYQANTGCVDANVDGFCDSSYTSGGITDTHPLSSYPFDYTAHLFNAEFIVDNEAFNITLHNPIDNETYIMVDGTGQLNFTFSQDSTFPDLTCDYIVDGSSVYTQLNPSQNVNYTQVLSSWTQGLHTFRVECFNDYQFEVSNEITFNVSFIVVVLGCTDSLANNYNPLATTDDGSCTYTSGNGTGSYTDSLDLGNLFSSDPQESVNEVKSTFEIMGRPLSALALMGIIVIFIGFIFLIFALPFLFMG